MKYRFSQKSSTLLHFDKLCRTSSIFFFFNLVLLQCLLLQHLQCSPSNTFAFAQRQYNLYTMISKLTIYSRYIHTSCFNFFSIASRSNKSCSETISYQNYSIFFATYAIQTANYARNMSYSHARSHWLYYFAVLKYCHVRTHLSRFRPPFQKNCALFEEISYLPRTE